MATKKMHGNVAVTDKGEEMAQNKFQLDESKADLNKDGKLSSYERARGEAIQKAKAEAPGLMMGGMMLESDPFAPFQVVMGTDYHSGNAVPAGSKEEEVRDDIPVMLSEGEYVVPADVVRYHGLKTFEELRCEAKNALGLMAMHDRISVVDEETKEPVDYDIEETRAPKVEKAKVKVVEAEDGTDIQTTSTQPYQLNYVTDPVTGVVKMVYTNPLTGEEISQSQYNASSATRFRPQDILDRELGNVSESEEEEKEDDSDDNRPSCPAGQTRNSSGVCVSIESQREEEDSTDLGPGTLGMSEADIDNIFSEVDPAYKTLMADITATNKDLSALGIISPVLSGVATVVNKVRKGVARTSAADIIRSGANIGITPSTDEGYADWRNSVSDTTAASIAISEKEATRVAGAISKDLSALGGSQYYSKEEAQAVATYGAFSDAQFDQIDVDFGKLTESPSDSTSNKDLSSVNSRADDDAEKGRSQYGIAKGGSITRKSKPRVATMQYSKGNN